MSDTLVGRLSYGGMEVAKGTMAYKHTPMDRAAALKSLTKRQSNLKIIPAPEDAPVGQRDVRHDVLAAQHAADGQVCNWS